MTKRLADWRADGPRGRRLKRTGLLLCASVALVLPVSAHHQRSQHADRAVEGWPLAPFVLQDQHGAALTTARLQGRWTFVLLGDSRCAKPCPEALQALAGMRARIAGTQALKTTQVLFVSLEPAHETPERLRALLAPFDPTFIGGTGAEAALRRFADDLALAPGPVAEPGAHRGVLVLIDPDTVLRTEYLPPYDVKLLTADYLRTRARR